MIIGTVQKQVSTWLINVKVMYQFQNPLTVMSFDNELSIYFFKSVELIHFQTSYLQSNNLHYRLVIAFIGY